MNQEFISVSPGMPSEADNGAPAGAIGVGRQLRNARQAKSMSTAEVAQSLKLSAHQVEALEKEDWSRLPGNTIIRGFVRNYARLLKLDADPLMAILDAAQMPKPPKLDLPNGTSTAMPQTGAGERRDLATVFSGLFLMALALGAYFFVPQDFWQAKLQALSLVRQQPAEPGETVQPAASPVASSNASSNLSGTESTAPAVPVRRSNSSGDAGGAPQSLAASVAAPATKIPPSELASQAVRLAFTKGAWVEVRDGSGQIIFSQLSPAGSQRTVEGQPPFALVVGNATHVAVEYKGKTVELTQRSRDDVARLTLD